MAHWQHLNRRYTQSEQCVMRQDRQIIARCVGELPGGGQRVVVTDEMVSTFLAGLDGLDAGATPADNDVLARTHIYRAIEDALNREMTRQRAREGRYGWVPCPRCGSDEVKLNLDGPAFAVGACHGCSQVLVARAVPKAGEVAEAEPLTAGSLVKRARSHA